jgi:hypothetical protein
VYVNGRLDQNGGRGGVEAIDIGASDLVVID